MLYFALPVCAQTKTLAPGLSRIEGTDSESGIAYTRILLEGKLLPSSPPASISPEHRPTPPPILTAQCTRRPSGKSFFELFANYGGIEDNAFHRPWQPGDGGLFPPSTVKVKITMEFLGYTHVKPVIRQWERLEFPSGQFRYNPPSRSSSNMEDSTYYLQYLKALPTLRLTYSGKAVEFLTTPLLDQIRKEPLCSASKL
ncbi:MAG: hypothetical protein ABI380_02350 [Edaphobacter sp.]